ncbi:hypothetical protein WMY93_016516 [Mugilogobius chulae]|uniref:Uncharacterized protein n=1 Tax=Mugilogobius chulae TaxID=88201 RepID=A0AAW0NS40_9GOBI
MKKKKPGKAPKEPKKPKSSKPAKPLYPPTRRPGTVTILEFHWKTWSHRTVPFLCSSRSVWIYRENR